MLKKNPNSNLLEKWEGEQRQIYKDTRGFDPNTLISFIDKFTPEEALKHMNERLSPKDQCK